MFTDKWGEMAGDVQRGRVGEGEGRRCVYRQVGRDGGVLFRWGGGGGGREEMFTDKWGEMAGCCSEGEGGGGGREEMCLQTSGERWRGVVQRGKGGGRGEGRRCVCKLLTGSLASEDVGVLLTGCVCVCRGGGGVGGGWRGRESWKEKGGGGGRGVYRLVTGRLDSEDGGVL